MNELDVGIIADQQLVILRVNGEGVAPPAGTAIAAGAMVARAGMQLAASTAPAESLANLAVGTEALTRVIEMASD